MKNTRRKIYLSSPTVNGKEMSYIEKAFQTNWIAPLGENVDQFELEIKKKTKAKFAVALNTGTAAIHLGLKALGVKRGDLVFCQDLTFSASCNPILYEGAIPVFIDSEEESWNLSPEALKKAFLKYPKPKAVVAVNLYGVPANFNEIRKITREYETPLLEDAAESLGAAYEGRYTGTFGEAGIYSFNGNKIITSSGGGMLVTDSESIAEKVRFWATQSKEKKRYYEHKEVGYNYRLSNIAAGIGRGQLETLEEFIKKKKNIYESYQKAFQKTDGVKMNPIPDSCRSNYWLSCLFLEESLSVKPLDLIKELEKEGIESRPIWKPMHSQPVFRDYDYIKQDPAVSISEKIYRQGLCLPSDIKNTQKDMEFIIDIMKQTIERRES